MFCGYVVVKLRLAALNAFATESTEDTEHTWKKYMDELMKMIVEACDMVSKKNSCV